MAFYNVVIPTFEAAGDSYKIIDQVKYHKIMGALLRASAGEMMCQLRHTFTQIHHWNKVYAVVVSGGSQILVSCPKEMIGVHNVDAEMVRHVSYLERVFADLVIAHGTDHCKGRTLYAHMGEMVSNIPGEVCKSFTDTCPGCIQRHQRNRHGFNTRGQVD